jgi:lysyl-tRNA synthetase class I
MVYSAAFDAMPDTVRERVYRRLYDVLTGEDQSPKFAKLSGEDRRNVLAILRDTKPNLPAYWGL